MITFNLNEFVKVQFYKEGLDIMKEKYISDLSLPNGEPSRILELFPWKEPKVDENGYSEIQLYELMYYFGEYLYFGSTNKPFNLNILLKERT